MVKQQIQDNSHRFWYRFCKGLVTVALHTFFRIRVDGTQHVPTAGPVILGSNHIHNFDPFLIGVVTKRYMSFMAKSEIWKFKPIGQLAEFLGAFPVRRGGADKAALKRAIVISEQGGCLCIFPEGRRSRTGKLGPGLPGAVFIARRAHCPIVPVAVIGTYRPFSQLTVRFGEPIFSSREDTNESLLERLMARIQILLDQGHVT